MGLVASVLQGGAVPQILDLNPRVMEKVRLHQAQTDSTGNESPYSVSDCGTTPAVECEASAF